MNSKFTLFLFLSCLFYTNSIFSQSKNSDQKTDTLPFNYSYWNGIADKQHLTKEERAELISGQKTIFNKENLHIHADETELIWVTEPAPTQQKGYGHNTINAGTCTNIDFESGTMSGWTRSTGYNPLTNVAGCCANSNGDQTILTGSGTDPYGGFPVVYPGSGSYSLRLGSTANGGIADRISQTVFVTPSNSNFTYYYAVVLNDGGHTAIQQSHFAFEVIDTLGNSISTYSFDNRIASAQQAGFTTSSLTGGSPGTPVLYKSWTPVAIDLSAHIGENVTIQFTVYDCSPTGHFAYAYIDGTCGTFATSGSYTICETSLLCASGFSTGTWNGPGITNQVNACITPTLPGTYTCATVMMSGYPGPTFTYSISLIDSPTVTFTTTAPAVCASQYTFNGSSSVATGSISSHLWSFGDGSTSSAFPGVVHNYTASGAYEVKLKAFSSNGCMDSVITTVTVSPVPVLSFSPSSNCINTSINFANTSSISPLGTIGGYTWTLGNGSTTSVFAPNETYTANGTYTITLEGVSAAGCPSSISRTLGIHPFAQISFSTNNHCENRSTAFSSSVSSGASGSVTSYYWYLGGVGISALPNPVQTFSVGTYVVYLGVLNEYNCLSSITQTLVISPNPVVSFTPRTQDLCSRTYSFAAHGFGGSSYTYNYDGNTTGNITDTVFTYTAPGNYTASLIGVSNMGCSDTAFRYITIQLFPAFNFTAASTCQNSTFSISTSAPNAGITNYLWGFGDPSSGAANTSTLLSPSHIYATANNYTIALTLTSSLSCSSHSTAVITVNPRPGISVNSGSICSGQSFTINPSGASTYTFLNGSSVVTPSTNSSYSITGTSAFGCISSSAAVSSVTVNLTPTISTVNGTICAGDSFTLSASGSNSYTFSGGTNIVSPLSTTVYTINGTSTQGCISANTASSTILVNPKPIVTVNSGTLCTGNSFTISPTGANSYTFTGGNSVVTPTTNTSYTVTGTGTSGCSNTAVSAITVYITPTITVNSGTICSGKSFTIFPAGASIYSYPGGNSVISPVSNTAYTITGMSTSGCSNTAVSHVTVLVTPTITINSGSICTGNSFTIIPSGAGNYTYSGGNAVVNSNTTSSYTVTGVNLSGCSNTAIVTVSVYVTPTITINSGTICSGKVFTLSPSGATTYFYSGGNSVVSPGSTTSYTVTGTSVSGCTNNAVSTVTVYTSPTITVNSGSICAGSSFTLSPSGASTYTYSGGNAIVSPGSTATYTITGSSIEGCLNSNTALSTVTVNPLPVLNVLSTNSAMCAGETTTLLAGGATSYTWQGHTPASFIIVSPTVATSYTVTGMNTIGCSNTVSYIQNVSLCTGLNSVKPDDQLHLIIYPNPSNGNFTIDSDRAVDLSIINALGQIVKYISLNENNKHSITVNELASGLYFLIGEDSKQVLKQILIVNK